MKLAGVTVLIYSQHHETADWANLLHWLSACLYVGIAVGIAVAQNASSVADLRAAHLRHIMLPQVSTQTAKCNGSTSVPALRGRGIFSEMFLLSAFATARSIGASLGGSASGVPHVAYCSKRHATCMDTLVFIDPRRVPGSYTAKPKGKATAVARRRVPGSFTAGLRAITAASPDQSIAQCRRWITSALHIGRVASAPSTARPRSVVLLTRRTQSVWRNRADAARELRHLVEQQPDWRFVDAGDAEALGIGATADGSRCYTARAQLALWRGAYAVVAPVGAHLSNLVFMRTSAGGLVQSNNCGFNTLTYASLARACGVRYTAAREVERAGRRCPDVPPESGFSAAALDAPREMDLSKDTLAAKLRAVLSRSRRRRRSRDPRRRAGVDG